jgi:hypothetical protein
VVNVTDRDIPVGVLKQLARGERLEIPGARSNGRNWGAGLTVVELRGKTNHFGRDVTTGSYIDYWATVPDVKVWVAECPFTKALGIRTDETGWWTMYVVKHQGVDLEFSFVYEKDGWITTKTNIITVGDDDITDLAIQYIDPDYYRQMMKPYVQAIWLGDTPLHNAMVVTVGKSWSSMHDGRLPHGDPGALASATPALGIGPIYFNRQVIPDPTQTSTSVDGGVAWLNMPVGHIRGDRGEGRRLLQDRPVQRRCNRRDPRCRAVHRLTAPLGRRGQRLAARPTVEPTHRGAAPSPAKGAPANPSRDRLPVRSRTSYGPRPAGTAAAECCGDRGEQSSAPRLRGYWLGVSAVG